jgi:enamine deaminase RidA (YjgF/YER057c/UK114 family)
MSEIHEKLTSLGLILPAPLQLPPGASLPFPWVRVVGTRALISGHGPTNVDGALAKPHGKVGADLTLEQAYGAARLTGLAILGSLQRELGDLDRIACWSRVFGMVNSAPGFNRQPAVINGFTDLIIEVFGARKGAHARSAVGLAELPFDIPVEVEAEVDSLLEVRDAHCRLTWPVRRDGGCWRSPARSTGVRCVGSIRKAGST